MSNNNTVAHNCNTFDKSVSEWVLETATMANLCGYRPIPYYSSIGRPSSFNGGKRYPETDPKWASADIVAIALDNVVLVDWDAYKEDVISLAELANRLGITEVELRSAEVQNDPTKDSKHFFFRLPDGIDRASIMDSNNGHYIKGVDFKTGNQLAYLKQHKELRNGMLPFVDSLPIAPSVITDVILKPKAVTTQVGELKTCTEENPHALLHLDDACNELAAMGADTGRNDKLNGLALEFLSMAHGGFLHVQTVHDRLLAAYTACGGDGFKATFDSANKKAIAQPRANVKPHIGAVAFGGATELPKAQDRSSLPMGETVQQWNDVLMAEHIFVHLTKSNKGMATTDNVVLLARQYGVTIRYNELSRLTEITLPPSAPRTSSDRSDDANMTEFKSLATRCEMSTTGFEELVEAVAARNSYNPLLDAINGVEWDGKDHVAMFLDTFIPKDGDTEYRDVVMSRWLKAGWHMMTNSLQAARSQRNVLTLVGAQMAGKTSQMKHLFGDFKRYVLEGQQIDPSNKDTKELISKHCLVEIGEIEATVRKSDMEALKAFITQRVDTFRPAYGRRSIDFCRKSFFYATANSDEFLTDATGNTRFQVLTVAEIKKLPEDFNYLQLWKQVERMYNADIDNGWLIPCELTPDELEKATIRSENARVVDDVEELLMQWRDNPASICADVKPIEILTMIKSYSCITKVDSRRIGVALRKMGYERVSKNAPFKNVKIPQAIVNPATAFKQA